MKIAYLISAHNDPGHLERLVKSLGEHAEFFIHIDAKVSVQPFEYLQKYPQVHIIRERVRTLWGDITQVYYQIALLRACLSSGIRFDRICTLSGLDYPLMSNSEIEQFFSRNPKKEYIQGINMAVQRPDVQKGYQIYRPRFFSSWFGLRTNSRIRIVIRNIVRILGYRKKLSFTVHGENYSVYKGGDWWCITPALAEYMLRKIDTCPEILRYFSTMFAPSELIWQTLVFNSPFAEQAILFTKPYESLAALTPLHYIYYHPVIKVLTEEDLPALLESKKMFCRKTVTGVSDRLMDKIDILRNSK